MTRIASAAQWSYLHPERKAEVVTPYRPSSAPAGPAVATVNGITLRKAA